MKIGISTSVIERGRTGISRYVLSLLRALLPYQGTHQFTLFVLEKDLPLFEFAEGMEIISVPEAFRPPANNIFWHQRTLPTLARRSRLNVLHIPSYRRMLWRKPCALVATIHDLAPFHVTHKYDWKRMLYGRYVARVLAHRQDAVIAISQSTAADIFRFFGVQPNKVNIIHNGLDHAGFFPADPALARAKVQARFQLGQPYFVYVSRLEHPGKNHVRLIEAFGRFKKQTGSKCQLVLAGKNWTGAEAIKAAAKSSPASSDIRFLGFVDEIHLPALYRAAQAAVYPSLFEGFGLPLVEAMACGCPVLCSRSGGLVEVVGQAALTIEAEDVKGMQEGLALLAIDSKLRGQMISAGLRQARNFDWDTAARATLDVYAVASLRVRGAHHPTTGPVIKELIKPAPSPLADSTRS